MECVLKSRFRFNDEFDLHLAREVCGQNPYEDTKRWYNIQINMIQIVGKSVSIRTLKERVQNLVRKHLKKNKLNEGKSGIEEIHNEIDDLVLHIIELIKEFSNKQKSLTPISSNYQKGFDFRDMCVEEMTKNIENIASNSNNSIEKIDLHKYDDSLSNLPTVEIITEPLLEENDSNEEIEIIPKTKLQKNAEKIQKTPKKRPLAQTNILSPSLRKKNNNIRQNTVQYLDKKNEHLHELKIREIALAERRQLLEERKHEFDVEERKKKIQLEEKRVQMEEKKLEMEEKRLNVHLSVFENQQNLIKIILEKNAI